MTDAEGSEFAEEISTTPLGVILSFFSFNMFNLTFVICLILWFVFCSGWIFNDDVYKEALKRKKRRKFNQWGMEKLYLLRQLSSKAANIKNFTSYSDSDVDNITIINTLINTIDEKVYQALYSNKVM